MGRVVIHTRDPPKPTTTTTPPPTRNHCVPQSTPCYKSYLYTNFSTPRPPTPLPHPPVPFCPHDSFDERRAQESRAEFRAIVCNNRKHERACVCVRTRVRARQNYAPPSGPLTHARVHSHTRAGIPRARAHTHTHTHTQLHCPPPPQPHFSPLPTHLLLIPLRSPSDSHSPLTRAESRCCARAWHWCRWVSSTRLERSFPTVQGACALACA